MLDINEIMIRHLDHSATDQEKEYLLSWLKQSEENRKEYFEIRDLWLFNKTLSEQDIEIEHALNRLRSRIIASTMSVPSKRFKIRLYFLSRVAVFLLLILSGSYLFFDKIHKKEMDHITCRLVTTTGNKGTFILPDGTQVWLNANSTLEYPEVFTSNKRTVRLQGEAYFEVKKDITKPFQVEAGEMQVEVLGTKFIVQNYERKSEIETILIDGQVKITSEHLKKKVILFPNQRLFYSKQTHKTKLETIDALNYIGWIHDKIIFDNDPLHDIITQMEHWYGIDIKSPEAFARSTHMSFTIRGESLNEILEAMKLIVPIQYKWEKNTLYILPKEN